MKVHTIITETTAHNIESINIHSYQLDSGAFVKYITITNEDGLTIRHTIFSDVELDVTHTREKANK